MNKYLESSTSIAHHLYHQEQESWYTTNTKGDKHMLLMDQKDGTFAEHH